MQQPSASGSQPSGAKTDNTTAPSPEKSAPSAGTVTTETGTTGAGATGTGWTAKQQSKAKPREKESARDTLESIVFAFVLAFLFRTFQAEAFVIPTGSMAPTLFGRHKEVACEQCRYEFEVGASNEILRDGNVVVSRIQRATCPNCRFSNASAYQAPPFKGDRILVNKSQYELEEPQRFDVVVFKYPEDSKTNFIKRLVGLPGETIRIHNGNVYRVNADGREEILRKDDPEKQQLIQIPVYDDGRPPRDLIAAGWPNRWAGVERTAQPGLNDVAGWSEMENGWLLDEVNRTYSLSAAQARGGQKFWLRYRHFVPDYQTWARFQNGDPLEPFPQLIGDYCGYNTVSYNIEPADPEEVFWVGDLTLSGQAKIGEIGPGAQFVLELTHGVHWYRCRITPHDGQAHLVRVDASLDADEEIPMASASTPLKGPGTYQFRFANVDDRLCLWINNRLIDFGTGAEYDSSQVHGSLPEENDYTPVGIAAQSLEIQLSNLFLERDIYYRGAYQARPADSLLLRNVAEWQKAYLNHRREADYLEFKIPDDHFFVLGDNSPHSLDGRFWQEQSTVPRSAFVGKAFYVYWPHGIPIGVEQGAAIKVSHHKRIIRGELIKDKEYPLHYFPFYPNFSRMQRIR